VGRRWPEGSASHQHPQSCGRWVPCPFPSLGMRREVGEGKAALSSSSHPLISARRETGAWFDSSHLHTGMLIPGSDLHLSQKPSRQAYPLLCTLSIPPSSSSPSCRLQERFSKPPSFPALASAHSGRNSAQIPTQGSRGAGSRPGPPLLPRTRVLVCCAVCARLNGRRGRLLATGAVDNGLFAFSTSRASLGSLKARPRSLGIPLLLF